MFFKVLQFKVYLIVNVVIFRGHFNDVQATCEISKNVPKMPLFFA